MPILSTPRLTLHPLTLEDAGDIFEVRGDPEAMAFWDWPNDESLAATAAIVDQLVGEAAAGHALYWVVRQCQDGRFVGLCDLSELRGPQADIGFMFVRRFWGLGFAQEAVLCILAQARALGLPSVRARIHRDNDRSARLLARAGFHEIDLLPRVEIRPGVFRDCRLFAIDLIGPSRER